MDCTIISGASGYIGKAFLKNLISKNDACFLITGRSKEKLEKVKKEMLSIAPAAIIDVFPADLTKSEEREKLFEFADEKKLCLKRLINVAGVDTQKAFLKYDEPKLLFQLRVNYEAALSLTLSFLKRAIDNKPEVLTISSMCGITPMPYFAVYSSSKAALLNFFTALSYELKGIAKITTVLPGSVETRPDVIEDIKKQGLTGKLSKKSPDYVAKKSLDALKKGKRIFVPGFYNKLVYFFTKITPKKLAMKIVAKKFKIKEKDAF